MFRASIHRSGKQNVQHRSTHSDDTGSWTRALSVETETIYSEVWQYPNVNSILKKKSRQKTTITASHYHVVNVCFDRTTHCNLGTNNSAADFGANADTSYQYYGVFSVLPRAFPALFWAQKTDDFRDTQKPHQSKSDTLMLINLKTPHRRESKPRKHLVIETLFRTLWARWLRKGA